MYVPCRVGMRTAMVMVCIDGGTYPMYGLGCLLICHAIRVCVSGGAMSTMDTHLYYGYGTITIYCILLAVWQMTTILRLSI